VLLGAQHLWIALFQIKGVLANRALLPHEIIDEYIEFYHLALIMQLYSRRIIQEEQYIIVIKWSNQFKFFQPKS
jgi:hypothetical protein